ncbi:MAG: tetratricopeptide repeat protein [Gemmatimonadetes bacterium]|nr:tetratricopeptide repeat protein [Gemmatimonadota bacterium]
MSVPIPTKAHSSDDAIENAVDWVRLNSRPVSIGAVIVVLAIGGAYLYRASERTKEARAEKAYFDAQRSVQAGNLPLAQSDLEKMLPRYLGTQSGTLAAMLLAQVHYQQGKFAEGIKVLTSASVSAPETMAASVQALMGAGYTDMQQYADAAKAYEKAATITRMPGEQESYHAEAARAWTLAGNKAEAIRLWKLVAGNPESNRVAEARVRLGELEATASK